MITYSLRPDQRDTRAFRLKDDKWLKVYEQQLSLLECITIHNEGLQDIYISSEETRPTGDNYDRLGPDGIVNFDLNPKYLWVQRSSSTSVPKVVVSKTWWTKEYLDEMIAAHKGEVEIILGGPSQ